MESLIGKYVKIVKFNSLKKVYYKIVYGYVTDEVKLLSSETEILLKGKFYSKNIDEKGKFLDGGYIDADGLYAVALSTDLFREVTQKEFEQFKNELINEVIEYGKNSTKQQSQC